MKLPARWNPLLLLSLAGFAAGLSAPGTAFADYWGFSDGGTVISSSSQPSPTFCTGTTNGTTNTTAVGCTTVPTVQVTGWGDVPTTGSTPGGGDYYLQQGTVKAWTGLGDEQGNETDTAPQHAIDNITSLGSATSDMILFSFNSAVELNQVTVGWTNGDYDMTVLAYTPGSGDPSAPDLSSNTYDPSNSAGLTNNGWTFIGDYLHSQDQTTQDINNNQMTINTGSNTGGTAVSSSYWLIGALNSTLASAFDTTHPGTNLSACFNNDAFKILTVAGVIKTPIPPQSRIPEPPTVLLAAAGIAALFRRRSGLRLPTRPAV